MKKFALAILIILIPINVLAANLIHPLDFKGTEAEKKKVIAQIKASVKETYSKVGMGDPSTLRMMEKEELKSFKELTKADNRTLLNGVIKQYCAIGMCNYNTILMMYNEQNKASKEELNW